MTHTATVGVERVESGRRLASYGSVAPFVGRVGDDGCLYTSGETGGSSLNMYYIFRKTLSVIFGSSVSRQSWKYSDPGSGVKVVV